MIFSCIHTFLNLCSNNNTIFLAKPCIAQGKEEGVCLVSRLCCCCRLVRWWQQRNFCQLRLFSVCSSRLLSGSGDLTTTSCYCHEHFSGGGRPTQETLVVLVFESKQRKPGGKVIKATNTFSSRTTKGNSLRCLIGQCCCC